MRVFRRDGYYQKAMHLHSLLCYGEIMNKRFKLYNVNMKYIRNLHHIDNNVPSVSPQIGKLLAALNLNNMIPVREEYITEIDLKLHSSDTPELRHWKQLCIKELRWCQSHQNEIEHLANELYRIYDSHETFSKRKICLNFPALITECNKEKEIQK